MPGRDVGLSYADGTVDGVRAASGEDVTQSGSAAIGWISIP